MSLVTSSNSFPYVSNMKVPIMPFSGALRKLCCIGYIVTTEGINCCSRSINVMLFGSLTNNPQRGPSVTVKIYLSSIHSQIKDYESVSKNTQ